MAFRKPGAKKLGLKVLLWGQEGTGKTYTALTFPKIAAIDSENGISLYEGEPEGENLQLVDNTQSFSELEENLDFIGENYEEEGIGTLVIDSETKVYKNIQEVIMEVEEKRARRKGRDVLDTNLSQRSWGKIGQISDKLQNLKIDLSSNGVHVVSIAQAEEVKEQKGDSYVLVGYKPAMRKLAKHDYDVVLFHYTEEDDEGNLHYFARVEKDRSKVFKKGDVIESPSYELWAERMNKNADKKAVATHFAKGSAETKKTYEEQVEIEEGDIKVRVQKLLKDLNEEETKKFRAGLKTLRITGLDGLTQKQLDGLEKLIASF